MKIVHFAEALKGGPATYLNELIPMQMAVHERVVLFCPVDQSKFIHCPGLEIITFPDTGRGILGIARLFWLWFNFNRINKFDLIHLHSTFAGIAGRLMPAVSGSKLIYCPHGWSFAMETARWKNIIYKTAERVLSKRADIILNTSRAEQILAENAGLPVSKFRLVYNGISDADWEPVSHNDIAKELLFVGRYDRQKGIDTLMAAFQHLRPLGYKLTTIGDTVVGKSLVQIPSDVNNLGWRTETEIRSAMLSAHLVIMPSRWEGFSLVALAAMRAGRAIVASNVSSLPEAVLDGETGILCQPGSSEQLADAIISASNLDVRALGLAGRRRYEELFTAEQMFENMEAVYRSCWPSQ